MFVHHPCSDHQAYVQIDGQTNLQTDKRARQPEQSPAVSMPIRSQNPLAFSWPSLSLSCCTAPSASVLEHQNNSPNSNLSRQTCDSQNSSLTRRVQGKRRVFIKTWIAEVFPFLYALVQLYVSLSLLFNKLVILDCNSGLHCLEGAGGRLTRGGRWDFVRLLVVGAPGGGESRY